HGDYVAGQPVITLEQPGLNLKALPPDVFDLPDLLFVLGVDRSAYGHSQDGSGLHCVFSHVEPPFRLLKSQRASGKRRYPAGNCITGAMLRPDRSPLCTSITSSTWLMSRPVGRSNRLSMRRLRQSSSWRKGAG